jgi:dolichol-phosphate mannosyltransferase
VQLGEVGYTFSARRHGQSKLDLAVGIEYLFMVVNKLLGGIIPPQLALYLMVGGCGLLVHLITVLFLMDLRHMRFVEAQFFATTCAMVSNFFMNNAVTFRDRQLRGTRIVSGLAAFVLCCSFGAWANIVLARALWQSSLEWYLAGLAGIVLGSVWNLSVSSHFTWPRRGRRNEHLRTETFAAAIEATR